MLKKISALLIALFCLTSFAFAMPTATKEAGSKVVTKTVLKKTVIVKKVKHWKKHLTRVGTAEGKTK